jgi:heparan-alpha-glucosaminide N-acetyltransferase
VTPVNTLQRGRVLAIDAFRGITFLAMIFVNELGGATNITPWLKHVPADADAMSFPDIVFPAFLFIVGMAIPFAIGGRIAKGDGAIGVQRHIGVRALALIVMGVFMVNAESGFNAASMPIPIALWSLLFYAAVMLTWGSFRFDGATPRRWMRVVGILIMIVLALLYRGGDDGRQGMTPQWWGILGLIGWAYLISSELYLLSRGRLAVLVAMLAGCVGYYAVGAQRVLPLAPEWLFSQGAHAAHSSIVLAGVICSLIYFDTARADSNRRRFVEATAFAAILLCAGWLLRPYFKISKIHATPSWCLYSAALCIALFGLLYWLIDIRRHQRWVRWVEPAATSPLVTYMIPFVIVAALQLAGLYVPAPLRDGWVGLAYAALFAVFVVWLVSLLNKRGVGLRL